MDYKLIYVCIVYLLINILSCHGYLRVCYYTNWSQYRKGIARFVPEDIDVKLCTHLIYAFAKLDGYKLAAVEWNDDTTPWSKGMYERFNNLKLSNPSLKTLLAVGGWNFGSKPFSDMASQPSRRSIFINSTIEFLRKRNFDGLDIDWEYPATRGGPPQDKMNLASLMKEMRKAFEEESKSTGKSRLLLTIAVPADEEKIKNGYDIEAISKSSDFINIMTYDFHGAWDPITGHNSPLFPRSKDMGYAAQKNINWVSNYWFKKGTPRSKIIIGFPLFGRGFTLTNQNSHDIGSRATGGSIAGPHTSEVGYIANFEVCKMIADGAKVYRDTEQKVPYLVQGDQWIGYDDKESFTEKANWVKQNKFGGVMFWSLALDDFTGLACKTGSKYPMISTVKRILTQKDKIGVNTKQQTSKIPLTSDTNFDKTVTPISSASSASSASSDVTVTSPASPPAVKPIVLSALPPTKNSKVDEKQTNPSNSNGQLKANKNANSSVDKVIVGAEKRLTTSTKGMTLEDKKTSSTSALATTIGNQKLTEENKTVFLVQSVPQTHSDERATTKENTDAKGTKPIPGKLSNEAKSRTAEEIQRNNNTKDTSKIFNKKSSFNSTSLNPDGLQAKEKEMKTESTDKETAKLLKTQNNSSIQNAVRNTNISASITTNIKNKETNNKTEITNTSQNISKQINTEELLKKSNGKQQNLSPTVSGSVMDTIDRTPNTTENKTNRVPEAAKTMGALKEGTNKGRTMTESSSLKVANGGDDESSKRKNETVTPELKETEVPNNSSKSKSNSSVSENGLDAATKSFESSKTETSTTEKVSAKTRKISDSTQSRKKSSKKSRKKSRRNSRQNSRQNSSLQNGQSSIQESTNQKSSGKVLSQSDSISGETSRTGVKQELKLEKNESKETIRMRRSNNNFDYNTHFRKRSLLQTTEVGNGANPAGFGSVLSSLLNIVSNFAVGGRERSVQQPQGSNTGGRRIEPRRMSVTPSPSANSDLQRRFGARRRLSVTPRPTGVPNSQRSLEARRRQTVTQGPPSRLQQALRLQQRTNARQNQQTGTNARQNQQTGSNARQNQQTGTNARQNQQTGSNARQNQQTGTNARQNQQTGTNVRQNQQTGSNAVDPTFNTGPMQNQRQTTNTRQDQQNNANAIRITNRRQLQNQRTNNVRQGTQVSSNTAANSRNRGQLQNRQSTRTRTQIRNGTPESTALFPSVESTNSRRTNADVNPIRPTQMNSVMRQRHGNAVQNNEIRLLQARRGSRLRNDNVVRTNNIIPSNSGNANRLTVSRDNILETRSPSVIQRNEDATRQRGGFTRSQKSVQNNPNTNQLRDSFLNQIPDLLENPPINTLDATSLQTALLRTQQRSANQNNLSARRNLRRPLSNRLHNLRQSLPESNNLNTFSLLHNNQIFRNQLPQLGAELDVTELGIVQGIPTASALGLQPINPTMGTKQSTEGGRVSSNNITLISNDKQSNRGQQPVRNLGVQPNIDAKRIMQNDLISRQRMLEQQNRITGGDNQIALLERLLSRQVLGSSNGLTRKELNEMSQLQGMINNQLNRNNAQRRLSMERINDNSLPTFNQIVPLSSSAQRRKFDSVSSANSILSNTRMEQNIGNEMLAIPNKLAQRPRNKLPTTQEMTPTSNSLNSLRFEDLKLGTDTNDLSMNSVLNQLENFKSQISSTLPLSLEQQKETPTKQTNITVKKTTSSIKPMIQNQSSKQTGNIANILKDRFPQLNANQITALTNEIKRQVKSVVKSNFSEKVRDMPSKKTSVIAKPSSSVPHKITEKIQSRGNENKLVTQVMEPKRQKNNENFNPIQGLEMLSQKRPINVGNTVNLEQLRQELMRSGLPGNLVIQINPSPHLNGRSDVNSLLSSRRLGVARGPQVPSVDVPSVRDQVVRQNNNILLRNPFRKQPRVPLALITTTPTPKQKIDAIQSPHELIIKEKGTQAIELSNLPSTPSSSPRQQFRASNQTVVLGSRSKAKTNLPKSEVLWKWQV